MNTVLPSSNVHGTREFFPTPRLVQVSMLLLAFLLPFLTWTQAAGMALLALGFVQVVLPRVEPGSREGDTGAAGPSHRALVFYLLSILALVLIYRHTLVVVAGAWAVMALGDGLAGAVGAAFGGPARVAHTSRILRCMRPLKIAHMAKAATCAPPRSSGAAFRSPTLPRNPRKTWVGSSAFLVFATLGVYVLTRWVAPSVAPDKALAVAVLTALVGAVVESLPIRLDDNISVPLVASAFMFCALLVERSALDSNLPYLGRRIVLAVIINLAFAWIALALQSIDHAGALVGFLLGVMVYMGWGWKSFLILVAFVFLASLATRLGYAEKSARGVAERRGGRRAWREVVANGLPGALFAILVITTHYETASLLAMIAAFAEAAGDTVSGEIGQWLSARAYLITTLQPVAAGENGGVSLIGTLAGVVASALVVALGYALGLCPGGLPSAALALGAAVAGNLFDSLLGATLERRALVTNGLVNFAGTAFAGALALGFSRR